MELRDFESECLERIRSVFQSTEFHLILSEEFGLNNQRADKDTVSHRIRIQDSIAKLGWPPPETGHVSISHTLGAGATLFHPDWQVGVDLEVSSRVQEKVVARVASSKELSLGMTPASLWVAKESAFKAVRNQGQPEVISAIEIESFDPNFDCFSFSSPGPSSRIFGQGLLMKNERYSLGIAFIKN